MRILISVVRYILLFSLAALSVSLLEPVLTRLYTYAFSGELGGGFDINFTGFVVLSYGFEFLLPVFLLTLGDKSRLWVTGAMILVLAIYEFYADPFNFETPLLLLISGFCIGLLVRFVATKTLGKIPALEPMKKYF